MLKVNLVLLLCLIQACFGSTLFARYQTVCCTECPRASFNYTGQAAPEIFKMLVINVMRSPMNDTYAKSFIISQLKKFPMEYSWQLLGRFFDMKQRVENGYAECSQDVSSSTQDLDSFTNATNTTVNMMLDAISAALQQNLIGESPNYINTYVRFIGTLKDYYNQVASNDIYSGTYMTAAQAEIKSKIVGMSLTAIAQLRFSEQEQNIVLTEYNKITDYCITVPSDCLYDIDPSNMTFKQMRRYFKNKTQTLPRGQAMSILYHWRSALQKSTQQQDQYDNYMFHVQNQTQDVVINGMDVALQNILPSEPSILSPDMLVLLRAIPLSGTVHVPEGVNQTEYENNGYDEGENIDQIWGKILGTFFGPLLYCKYPGFYETLLNQCESTCEQTC